MRPRNTRPGNATMLTYLSASPTYRQSPSQFFVPVVLLASAIAGSSALSAPSLGGTQLSGGALGDLTKELSSLGSRSASGHKAATTMASVSPAALSFAQELYPGLKQQIDSRDSFDGKGSKPAALTHAEHRRNAVDDSVSHDDNSGMCSVGSPQCCNQVVSEGKDSSKLAALAGLKDLVGAVGLSCTSIPVIGAAVTNYCKSSPLCCDHVTQNGLINFGCVNLPIN